MTKDVRRAASEAELRHTAQKGLANMVTWFAREYPFKAALSVVLFLVSGVLDSVGILLLLPALALIIGESAGTQNWVTTAIFEFLDALSIPHSVTWILLLIVAVVLVKFVLRIFAGIIVGDFAARITQQVRAELLIAMVRAKWALFTREKTGDYIQALVNDAGKTSKASLAISQGISRILQIAFLTATSFLISWQFTLAALVLGSITTFGLHYFIRVLKRIAHAQVISMRLLNSRLIDGIGVMKALKAMGREGPFRENVLGDVDKLYNLQRRSIISNEFMRLIPEPTGAISIAIGMAVLLPYWDAGAESLLTVLYLFFRLHQGVSDLPLTMRDITTGQPAFYFVMSLRDATRAFEERKRGSRIVEQWQRLSFDNVSFRHDNEPILSGADLTIRRGEFVTFFGPSGSGKTTTVDLLIGLLEPNEGEILLDGVSLYEFDSTSWRGQIGYVPQECVLFNGTILDNIRLGDDAITEDRVRAALISANALEFVEGMPNGLHTMVSERGLNLSGGQQQRLSLARALVRHPTILVLDEVTSALDHETEESICAELQRLHRQTDRDLTVIAISHRPRIADIADRFFRIRNGKVVETAKSAGDRSLVHGDQR